MEGRKKKNKRADFILSRAIKWIWGLKPIRARRPLREAWPGQGGEQGRAEPHVPCILVLSAAVLQLQHRHLVQYRGRRPRTAAAFLPTASGRRPGRGLEVGEGLRRAQQGGHRAGHARRARGGGAGGAQPARGRRRGQQQVRAGRAGGHRGSAAPELLVLLLQLPHQLLQLLHLQLGADGRAGAAPLHLRHHRRLQQGSLHPAGSLPLPPPPAPAPPRRRRAAPGYRGRREHRGSPLAAPGSGPAPLCRSPGLAPPLLRLPLTAARAGSPPTPAARATRTRTRQEQRAARHPRHPTPGKGGEGHLRAEPRVFKEKCLPPTAPHRGSPRPRAGSGPGRRASREPCN